MQTKYVVKKVIAKAIKRTQLPLHAVQLGFGDIRSFFVRSKIATGVFAYT